MALLQILEYWKSGLHETKRDFMPRHHLFLRALHECEDIDHKARKQGAGALGNSQRRMVVECGRALLAKAGIVACDDGKVIL